MQSLWSTAVVDRLCEMKRAGVTDFDLAWHLTTSEIKPRRIERGRSQGALFDTSLPVNQQQEESLMAFTRRVCEDAWYDRKPALGQFSPELLLETNERQAA